MLRLVVLLLAAVAAEAAVAITHPGVAELTLDAGRVRDLLTGRVTTWSDGAPVVVVLISDADADAALAAVVGRDRARLQRGWKRLVFSGNGAMPIEAADLRAALDLVARTPGAVAVIAAAPPDDRLRIHPLSTR